MTCFLNPYRLPVEPKPYNPCEEGEHIDDPYFGSDPCLDFNVFSTWVVAQILERNNRWILDRPRNTSQIKKVLFPSYAERSMNFQEILGVINYCLWDRGYDPDEIGTLDPTWKPALDKGAL